MTKPRSRKPAKALSSEAGPGSRDENASDKTRPTRRSIVELTEAACRAADDELLPPVVVSPAQPLPARGESETNQDASGTCELKMSDSTADMAVKIAKAYQANTLDDIKLGFNAALDYAAELAKGRALPNAAGGHAAAEPDERSQQSSLAAEYRAEAVEMMTANVATTLDMARRLFEAKTSAEWVELASTHARMQCELMVQQGRTLRSLARSMTGSPAGQAGSQGSTTRK
jgi:hypothetical protein